MCRSTCPHSPTASSDSTSRSTTPAPPGRQARAAVRPVPRPRGLRRADPRARDPRHLHDRRRRAAQLGAAGRARTSRSGAGARAPTSRCAATTTPCGSARSRTTGVASPGCSYTEGVSWGKFVPEAEGGRFAEVPADATIAWPLVVRAVMERIAEVRSNAASGRCRRGWGRCPDRRSRPHVEPEDDPTRTDLHLLTRVRFSDADGEDREFFASILELGPRSGRIESGRPLETGCQLSSRWCSRARGSTRNASATELRRARAHDEPNLSTTSMPPRWTTSRANASRSICAAINGNPDGPDRNRPRNHQYGRRERRARVPVDEEAADPAFRGRVPAEREDPGRAARPPAPRDRRHQHAVLVEADHRTALRFPRVRNFRDRYPLELEEPDGWPAFRTRAGLVTPVEVATHVLEALIERTGIDPKPRPSP